MRHTRKTGKASAIVGVFGLALIPGLLAAQGAQSSPAERAPAVEMDGFRISPPDPKWGIEISGDRTSVIFSRSKGKGLLSALAPVPQRREASVIVSARQVSPWDWTMGEAAATDYFLKGYTGEVASTWSSSKLLEKGEVERGDQRLRYAKFEVTSYSPDGVPLITDLLVYIYLPPDFRKSHRYFQFEWVYMRPSGGLKLYRNPGSEPVLAVFDSLKIVEPLKDIPGPEGELIRAAVAGNAEAARLALDNGAGPDAAFANFTALSEAAFEGRRDVVELLLDRGADIDRAAGISGDTPLMYAIVGQEADIVAMLMERGANVNKKNKDGDSPLDMAALTKQTSLASSLLERGAEVEAKNEDGTTPLMLAARSGAYDLVKLLVEKGAKIDVQSDDGTTSLMEAVGLRRVDVANFLLSLGSNVNLKRVNGVTALWLAVDNEVTGIPGALVKRGADLKGQATGELGDRNPNLLHLAIVRQAPWLAKLAVEAGIDVNAKNKAGQTPLMRAAGLGEVEVVQFLLEKGADINAKDGKKRTAAWWAKAAGEKETAKILKAAGAR